MVVGDRVVEADDRRDPRHGEVREQRGKEEGVESSGSGGARQPDEVPQPRFESADAASEAGRSSGTTSRSASSGKSDAAALAASRRST